MRKLGYIRTSTSNQLIDRQVNQLQEYCDEVFIEEGASAVGKNRPVYQEVMAELEPGDVFVVLSLDRAYRSVIDALSELKRLEEQNIQFCSLQQNFDTRTPEGKLLYTISAALAEWERNIISMRTKEGMEAAKARGAAIGRPRKLSERQIDYIRCKTDGIAETPVLKTLSKELDVSRRTVLRAVNSIGR